MIVKKLTANVDVEIDIDHIIESMVDNLDPKDIIDFIKKLDEEYGDWDLTLDLYDYFKEQKQNYEGETKKIQNDGIWRV